MRFKKFVLPFMAAAMCMTMPMTAFATKPITDKNNGNWADPTAILLDTSEAEIMVRVGDIDSCNQVDYKNKDDEGYFFDPFTSKHQGGHDFPWAPNKKDAKGTDAIAVGSKFKKSYYPADGYADSWINDSECAKINGEIKIGIDFKEQIKDVEVKTAAIQIGVDDFQAPSWHSNFKVTLNGKRAKFLEEVINNIDQTGPTIHMITAIVPEAYIESLQNGELHIYIDETTGVGDGFAVDFVKLLINYNPDALVGGTISGKTLPGATVRLLGTSNIVTADKKGNFKLEANVGLNALRVSKPGYVERYINEGEDFEKLIVTRGKNTKAYFNETIELDEGPGKADVDYSKYGSTYLDERNVILSKDKYTYTGSAITPKFTVVNYDGDTLKANTDYTVSYKNNKNAGRAQIIIKGKGDYKNITITKSFSIVPKATTISSVKALTKSFEVKWNKQAVQTTGYEIRYSTKSNFSDEKIVKIAKNTTLSSVVKNLSAKKKYYIQIRTYKTVGGVKYYSDWSKSKTVTTK